MALNGYDISNYQKNMSISKVASDFVIIKATQGTTYYSPSFEKQITEAFANNRLVGVYHYVSSSNYKSEVDFFISKIKPYIGKVLICVDWEGKDNPMFGNVNYITGFMDYLYSVTKVKPIIYMSKSVARSSYWTTVPNNYELWCAQYKNNDKLYQYNPNPWTDTKGFGKFKNPIIYQYSSKGHLPGYNSDLDLDIAYMTRDEWINRCRVESSAVINDNASVPRTALVTAETLNIRTGSSSSTKDLGDLKRGSVITIDKVENGFAHFEGWCSLKYLQ